MNASARAAAPSTRWLTFSVDTLRFALPLEAVERIVRAAEYTPLPLAPDVVLGALDVAGEILPVFSPRRRFRLADRPLAPTDQFVLARSARRRMVLAVDAALELIEKHPPAGTGARPHVPDLPYLRGALSLPDGLVLIQDLERFLLPEESDALDAAIREEEVRRAR
jgi:purine-binding chemotaxis protein CheW